MYVPGLQVDDPNYCEQEQSTGPALCAASERMPATSVNIAGSRTSAPCQYISQLHFKVVDAGFAG